MGRSLGALIGYACLATVLAEAAALGLLWMDGKLSHEKVFRVLAVIHDVDLDEPGAGRRDRTTLDPDKQPSYQDIVRRRGMESRLIEMKMQALQDGLDQVEFQRVQLAKEKERHRQNLEAFKQRLQELEEDTEKKGYQEVRVIWETIPPKQAKESILNMVEAGEIEDVVTIMSDMPIVKRAKIIREFDSEREMEVLDQILRLIREGGAVQSLIDNARQNIEPAATDAP